MKQETTLEKQSSGKPITDSRLAIRLRDALYPLLIFLTGTKVRYRVEKVNACQPIPGKPIIFAANHSAFQDTPIMLRVTKRRSYIFSGRQNLAFIDWVFFVLNGTIWVDRKSKEDMAASKDAVLEYLAKGQSILWFPEGTWNLTPSQLMMPMKWGIIDMARQAEAQIVPAALDYDWEKNTCRIKFGTPMVGEALENKAEAIRDLRDTMATLRWDLMCDQPIVHRGTSPPNAGRNVSSHRRIPTPGLGIRKLLHLSSIPRTRGSIFPSGQAGAMHGEGVLVPQEMMYGKVA